MGTKLKIFGGVTGVIIGAIVLAFAIGLVELGYYKFFKPKYENVDREVFENTKSYIQGVQQDLGKYYLEYQEADENGKAAIRSVIQIRFAEVDPNKLQSSKLRTFLTNTRGY